MAIPVIVPRRQTEQYQPFVQPNANYAPSPGDDIANLMAAIVENRKRQQEKADNARSTQALLGSFQEEQQGPLDESGTPLPPIAPFAVPDNAVIEKGGFKKWAGKLARGLGISPSKSDRGVPGERQLSGNVEKLISRVANDQEFRESIQKNPAKLDAYNKLAEKYGQSLPSWEEQQGRLNRRGAGLTPSQAAAARQLVETGRISDEQTADLTSTPEGLATYQNPSGRWASSFGAVQTTKGKLPFEFEKMDRKSQNDFAMAMAKSALNFAEDRQRFNMERTGKSEDMRQDVLTFVIKESVQDQIKYGLSEEEAVESAYNTLSITNTMMGAPTKGMKKPPSLGLKDRTWKGLSEWWSGTKETPLDTSSLPALGVTGGGTTTLGAGGGAGVEPDRDEAARIYQQYAPAGGGIPPGRATGSYAKQGDGEKKPVDVRMTELLQKFPNISDKMLAAKLRGEGYDVKE